MTQEKWIRLVLTIVVLTLEKAKMTTVSVVATSADSSFASATTETATSSIVASSTVSAFTSIVSSSAIPGNSNIVSSSTIPVVSSIVSSSRVTVLPSLINPTPAQSSETIQLSSSVETTTDPQQGSDNSTMTSKNGGVNPISANIPMVIALLSLSLYFRI